MKILHLATHESSGAGRGASRLHQGLLDEDIDSSMLVLQKGSNTPSVHQIKNPVRLFKRIQAKASVEALKVIYNCHTTFSVNLTPSLIQNSIKKLNPSIINIHWVGREFLNVEEIKKFKTPLVWTLHDMWPFTGGCHYNELCDRYIDSCGACPQLPGAKESDLSRQTWQRKAQAWKDLNITIVASSLWMAECARASSLFRHLKIELIPLGLDTQTYKPTDLQIARQLFNLPPDKQIVLFGAMSATKDTRKGFHLLVPALQKLSKSGWSDRIELIIFGASQPENPIDLGFKTHYLGAIADEKLLASAYSAADVMIVPSLQESFGQTASESLACGTPVVAFNATGLKDIVDHQINGYLAKPYEIEDLAQGIAWILEDKERHLQLRNQARLKAERAFPLDLQARRYLSLYTTLLENQAVISN